MKGDIRTGFHTWGGGGGVGGHCSPARNYDVIIASTGTIWYAAQYKSTGQL